jgi:hypothetical protein
MHQLAPCSPQYEREAPITGPTSTSTSPICRSRSRRPNFEKTSSDPGHPGRKSHQVLESRIDGRATAHLPYPYPRIDPLAEQQRCDCRAAPKQVPYEGSPYPHCGSHGSRVSTTGGCPGDVAAGLNMSCSAGVGSHALENAMPSLSRHHPLSSRLVSIFSAWRVIHASTGKSTLPP